MTISPGSTGLSTRTIPSYDPAMHIRTEHPQWEIRYVPLNTEKHHYLVIWPAQTVYVDRETFARQGPRILAQVAAHLDQHQGMRLTKNLSREAKQIATVRLDLPDSRPT